MIRIGADLDAPDSLGRPVATVGVFDGVHLGHQCVLAALREWAGELGTTTLVVTFDRSPRAVTRGEPVPCITSPDHKLTLLERLGVDACAVLPFDERLRRTPAREFVTGILCGRLRACGVLLGFNARFGRDAEGGIELLRTLESEGVCLARQIADPVTIAGRTVSSSAIREAVERGELGDAAAMLGRPVSILGTVVPGEQRGSRLGFPTANLDLHHEVKPPAGVYATEACVAGAWRPALTSIGRKPTFPNPPTDDVVEVFVPGLAGELYGEVIEVRFGRKLRDQVRFDSPDALTAQIEADVQALRGEYR